MDKTHSIDEMPSLKARLGKAGTDRVRYHESADTCIEA